MTENINPQKQKLIFIVMCLVSAAGSFYYCVRVGHAFRALTGHNPTWPLYFAVLFFLLVQLYSNKTKRIHISQLYRILVLLSGVCIAFLVFGGTWMVLFDVIFFVLRIIGVKRLRYEMAAGISAVLSVVTVIYGVIHAKKIRTVSYSVSTDKVREGYRIVQLSDLHLGSVVGAGQMRRAVEAVNALKPDLVVITGDIINHGQMNEVRRPLDIEDILKQIRSKDGVYAVTGNHDPAADDPVFRLFLKNADVRLLDNESVSLPQVTLYGRNGNSLRNRRPIRYKFPAEKYTVILDHYPDGAEAAAGCGADLLLAGHTHAGQYFPCTWFIRANYHKNSRHGQFRVGKTDCIVSAGTGYFQIPVRFGSDSEVVCVDVKPIKNKEK